MKKESIIAGVIGLLAGVVIASFAAGQAVNNNNVGMMQVMGMDTNKVRQQTATSHDTMSMADMTEQLKSKTGDDFDKAFLEMMISHHGGAVDMAKLIPTRTKHDEINKLGESIITVQAKEIANMKQLQHNWGYSPDESMQMMHGSR